MEIPGKKNPIYSYAEIVDYELLEDGASVTKGGVGSAAVGGVLFGGVGAIVGGGVGKKNQPVCLSMKIKITVKNMQNPVVYINCITGQTRRDNVIYKEALGKAHECLSVLQLICEDVEPSPIQTPEPTPFPSVAPNYTSTVDELNKYKELLDGGVITEDEFQTKKKQLLGI